MFVGHFAAGLAGKAIEPRAPLWSMIAASQFLDWGWSGLVLAGVEHFRIDPHLPGSALALYDMPWTHSLPGALALSALGGAIARFVLGLRPRAAVVIGAVVVSHWALDLLVHRPDLLLWPGGPKVGLSLWNQPVPEEIVEIGLLAVVAPFWAFSRAAEGRRAWPAALFLAGLLGLQFVAASGAETGTPQSLAATSLAIYLLVTLAAWWLDRGPARTA